MRGVFCIRRRGVGSWGTGFVEPKNNAPIMEALLYHYILGRGVWIGNAGGGSWQEVFRGSAALFWGLGNSLFLFLQKCFQWRFRIITSPSLTPTTSPTPENHTSPVPPHSSPPDQHAHTTMTTLIMPIAAITPTTSSNARSHCPCSSDSHFLSFPWVLPGFLFLKTSERYG